MTQSLYSRTQVEEWQATLVEIADKPRMTFTKKEVVEELIDTIELALKKRSYREVADELNKKGLDISEGSLKKYVSQYRRAHSTEPTAAKVIHSKPAKAKRKSSGKRSSTDVSLEPKVTTSEPVLASGSETAVAKPTQSPKKLGKGRLSSDDSSTRYPGGQGEPISMSADL